MRCISAFHHYLQLREGSWEQEMASEGAARKHRKMKHGSAQSLTGPEESHHGRGKMVRQPRVAPRRLALSWTRVRVGCLQERARRAVGLALIRKWRWVLLRLCVRAQIHGTRLGFYLAVSACCLRLPRALGDAARTPPETRPRKVRPKFSGGEGAPKTSKGSRGGTDFFWDEFWDDFWGDFWDLLWAMPRGPVGNLGLQPVASLLKGCMRRLVCWLQASGGPGGKSLGGSAGRHAPLEA